MSRRIKTNYPGVYYRESQRVGQSGTEKIYYIVFKKDSKVFEEKVGRQYIDAMTPAKASQIRGMRLEGRLPSRKEKRLAEQNKWTIKRLWLEYKASSPNLKGIITDENRFKNHLLPYFGDKQPKEITTSQVDRLRVSLLKEKKPQTVKHVLALLRRTCNFGVRKQLCEGLRFVIEMPRVNNKKTEDLTAEQLQSLMKVLDQESDIQIANLMRLALFTGMRRGELFRLQWADVDFDRGFIHIRDPKNNEDQTIPLNQQAGNVLENHPWMNSPYVFPGRDGNQRVDIRKQVNRIKSRAGLPEDFRALHGLRHVYASILASSGQVDMYTLQRLLTHKDASMTQRYAHLRDETIKKASNLAGELIEQQIDITDNQNKSRF